MGGVRLQGRPDLCLYVREQCSKEWLEGFRFCTMSCTSESVAAFDFSWDKVPTENMVNPKTSSPEFTCTYILVYAPPTPPVHTHFSIQSRGNPRPPEAQGPGSLGKACGGRPLFQTGRGWAGGPLVAAGSASLSKGSLKASQDKGCPLRMLHRQEGLKTGLSSANWGRMGSQCV